MITTALTWLFNNLPVDDFHIALRPALQLLRHILLYAKYIGNIISWSWGTIKSYDKGFGVTLTAMWLLPVVLVPGTLSEHDWPAGPVLPESIPLPSNPTSQPTSDQPTSPSAPTPSIVTPQPPEHSTPLLIPEPLPTPPNTPPITPPITPPTIALRTAPSLPLPSPLEHANRSLNERTPVLLQRWLEPLSPRPAPEIQVQLPQLSSLQTRPPNVVAYPSPTNTNPNSPNASSTTISMDVSRSISIPRSVPHQLSVTQDMLPSPPADPNDLRLLRAPALKCSPLPPEDVALPV